MKPVVLVTGSSRGIGLAIARKFAENHYKVALNCLNNENMMNANLSELRETNPYVAGFVADVSNYGAVTRMFGQIEEAFGPIDVLINNAGIAHVGLFTDMTPGQWTRVVESNLLSVFNCCHLALPSMIRRQKGVIVNVSSMWGKAGASCEAVYSATKGAVDSFTKSMAKEYAPCGIRVNAVACGIVDTGMNDNLSDDEKQAFAETIPMGRFGKACEIAEAVYFLASPAASYMNGHILSADGGLT